jgi:hypothetical protein
MAVSSLLFTQKRNEQQQNCEIAGENEKHRKRHPGIANEAFESIVAPNRNILLPW